MKKKLNYDWFKTLTSKLRYLAATRLEDVVDELGAMVKKEVDDAFHRQRQAEMKTEMVRQDLRRVAKDLSQLKRYEAAYKAIFDTGPYVDGRIKFKKA